MTARVEEPGVRHHGDPLVQAPRRRFDRYQFTAQECQAIEVALIDAKRIERGRSSWLHGLIRDPERPLANKRLESLRLLVIAVLVQDNEALTVARDLAARAGVETHKITHLTAYDWGRKVS